MSERYQVGRVTPGEFTAWQEFIAACLCDLHSKGEVSDVLMTVLEIRRRMTQNPDGCRVWLVFDVERTENLPVAMLVTDVVLDECGRRLLHLWLGWIEPGQHGGPMAEEQALIDEEAERLGCSRIQISSDRPGYGRWAKRFGFEPRTTIYQRPVKRRDKGAQAPDAAGG